MSKYFKDYDAIIKKGTNLSNMVKFFLNISNDEYKYKVTSSIDFKKDKDENIKYDYLVSVEGGFSPDENGLPFVVTYALIENKFGQKSTGKSLGIRLNREMYKYIREGNSLNSLIENIENSTDNKKFKGIMGYLSNGIYKRDRVDTDSLISAFIPLLNRDRYDTLTQNIRENKKV